MSLRRTAQGKMLDMAALAAKNEKVRAVGNMNVNARGDILDSQNKVIKDNTRRVNANYNKTVQPRQTQPVRQTVPERPQIMSEPPVVDDRTAEERSFDDEE